MYHRNRRVCTRAYTVPADAACGRMQGSKRMDACIRRARQFQTGMTGTGTRKPETVQPPKGLP